MNQLFSSKFSMQLKRILLVIAFILFKNLLSATNNQEFAVSLIPNALITKANAIIRSHDITITVFEDGSAEEEVVKAITILNEKGNSNGYFIELFDKFSSVSGVDGIVYDKNGKRIKKLRVDDFLNISAISGFSLYEDNRIIFSDPKVGIYPYTVIYKYKKKLKSFFNLPMWVIYPGFNISIQNATFKLITNGDVKVFFNENSLFKNNRSIIRNEPLMVFDHNKRLLYTENSWSVNNISAIEEEQLSDDFITNTPILRVVPQKFKMDDFEGNNESWASFGDWIYRLGRDKKNLSESTKQSIKNLVKDAKNDFEKAKILYDYLQNKVRYVSIQVGIGGFQPFAAETVDKLSYGDCKALTNYMKSILEVVGIKSYYCLVKSGENASNINKDFVSSQFNHAFLMLPLSNDTIYLECTSQLVPFGYNGSFTDDRDILVIDSTRSFINHSNIYSKEQNKTTNTFFIVVGNDLKSKVTQKGVYVGVASEKVRSVMYDKPEKQKERIQKRFDYKNISISNVKYNEIKERIPIIEESFDFSLQQIGQISNNSLIIPFNQVSRSEDFNRNTNRRTDIIIKRSSIHIDTIRIITPKDFIIDKMPIPKNLTSDFGQYKLDVISKENCLTFIRTVEWKKGRYDAVNYANLILFQKQINEIDKQVIILKTK